MAVIFSRISCETSFSRPSRLSGDFSRLSGPLASRRPSTLRTVTSSVFMLGTAAATRWRIAWPAERSSPPSVRMITEAEGGCVSRRNDPSSDMTIWTRAALTPRIIWIVRASSPSIARTRVTSCMNEVRPSEPNLS